MIRPRWRKVFSDLWDNKARTLLVVASISVGVFALGMIAVGLGAVCFLMLPLFVMSRAERDPDL